MLYGIIGFVAGLLLGYFCRPAIDKLVAKPKGGGGPGEPDDPGP